jgi:hypothetical protein
LSIGSNYIVFNNCFPFLSIWPKNFGVTNAPFIAKDGEVTVYFGTVSIIIAIAAIVRILSRQAEHAVSIALGLIPIALFFTRQ